MEELDKPKVSITAIVISAVLAAVVFGGGIYAYQSNKAKKDQDALKNQITTLETEKANLEKQVADSASTTTTTQTNTSTTSENVIAGTENWKTYSSSELKVSFRYPAEYGDISVTTGKGGYFADGSGKITEIGKITTIKFSNYNETSGDKTRKYIESCAVSSDFRSDRGDSDICWVTSFKKENSYKEFTNQSGNPVYINEKLDFFAHDYTAGYLPLQTSSGYVALTFSKSATDTQFRSDIEKILKSSKNL